MGARGVPRFVCLNILAVESKATGPGRSENLTEHSVEQSALCYLQNTIIYRQEEPDM